jgi:hypothetical protein
MKKAMLLAFAFVSAVPAFAGMTITDTCQQEIGSAAARIANAQIDADKYMWIAELSPGESRGVFTITLEAEDCDDVETFSVHARLTPASRRGAFDCQVLSAKFVKGGGQVTSPCSQFPKVKKL